MKKAILLTAAGLVALSANARGPHKKAVHEDECSLVKQRFNNSYVAPPAQPQQQHFAKGTANIYSETFTTPSGTAPYLPTGWTTGTFSGPNASWKYYNQGQVSPAPYTIAAIATTGGFAFYDSDSIGGGGTGPLIPAGWMQTPPIICTGHSGVGLTFDENYRRFADSTFIDVSTNVNFTSYTRYPISYNNGLNTNDGSPNPYKVFVNITSAAANQATVYIRFSYYGPAQGGGGYGWAVDNVSVDDLAPVNISIHGGFLYSANVGEYAASIGRVASLFRDSVAPVIKMDNNGSTAVASTLNCKIFKNGTQVYDQTLNVTAAQLPTSSQDSIQEFPLYFPDAVGGSGNDVYFAAYAVTAAGNVNTTTLRDTVPFAVLDTLWDQNIYAPTGGGYYLHKPVSGGEASFYQGTRFDVPAGVTDTISGVSAAFSSGTTAGVTCVAGIYNLDFTNANGWHIKYVTYEHALTASEISTNATTGLKWAYFPIDYSQGQAIIDAGDGSTTTGTWAAVFTTKGAAPSSTVVLYSTKANPATGYIGYYGQSDSSQNDGGAIFGLGTQATGQASTSMIRLHFGKNRTGVTAISTVDVWKAYPNPSNDMIYVPFKSAVNGNVEISVANAVGQVVRTQSMKMQNGEMGSFDVVTSDLANGVYFFTISAGGERYTNRFVVAH